MSWPSVAIGDVCTLMTGGTPKTSVSEFYENGTVPWIVSGDINKGEIYNCDKRITEYAVENSNARYLPKDSVLIALNGQGKTRGTVALLRIEGATCNQSIVSINPDDKENLSSDYLFYYLKSQYQNIRNITGDKDRAGLNMPLIRAIKLPLPPLTEQKRIAAILDKADAIRRKRQQATQLADEFLRAVFLDMFGDPVTNPRGWETSKLRELVYLQGGYAFKSGDFCESGIPVVKIGNANKAGFTTKEIAFVNPSSPEKLKQYELYPSDLLMSLTGTVGKDDYANVTIVSDDYGKYYLNQRVAKISIISERVSKHYLKYLLADHKIKSEITKNNRGVRQANISNGDVYELNVPVPDSKILKKFDQLVEQTSELIKNIKLCPKLDLDLFYSLSQKAFSGKL